MGNIASINLPISAQGEWAAKRFYGDPKLAAAYLPIAYKLAGDVKNRMELGGVAYGHQLITLVDGTRIRVIRNGTHNIIAIDTRGTRRSIEQLLVLYGYCCYPRNSTSLHGWLRLDGKLTNNTNYPFDYSPGFDYATNGIISHFGNLTYYNKETGSTNTIKTADLKAGLGNKLYSGNQFAFDPDSNDVYSIVHSAHGDLGMAVEMIIPDKIEYNTKSNLAVIYPPGGKESFYMPFAKWDTEEGRWRIVSWVYTEYFDFSKPDVKIAIALQPTPAILYKNGKQFWELQTDIYFPVGVGFFTQSVENKIIKSPIMVCSVDLRSSLIFIFDGGKQYTVGLGFSAKLVINSPVKFSKDGHKACLVVFAEDFAALVEFSIGCSIDSYGNVDYSISHSHTEHRLRQYELTITRETGVPEGVATFSYLPPSWWQPFGVGWAPPLVPDSVRRWSASNYRHTDTYLSGSYPLAAAYNNNGDLQIAMVHIENDNTLFVHREESRKHENSNTMVQIKWDYCMYHYTEWQLHNLKLHDGVDQRQYLSINGENIEIYYCKQDTITDNTTITDRYEMPGDRHILTTDDNKYSYDVLQRATYFEYLDIVKSIILKATATKTIKASSVTAGTYGWYTVGDYWAHKDTRITTEEPEKTTREVEVSLSSPDFYSIHFKVGA